MSAQWNASNARFMTEEDAREHVDHLNRKASIKPIKTAADIQTEMLQALDACLKAQLAVLTVDGFGHNRRIDAANTTSGRLLMAAQQYLNTQG